MNFPPFSLQRSRNFIYGFILLFIAGLLLLLLLGKSGSFIALNPYHNEWLDNFFIYYTYTGDGLFALLISLILISAVKTRKVGIAILIAFLFSGLLAQLVKNLVDSPRPAMFFEPGKYLYLIKGVSLSNNASFPSGHTTSAFAVATVLALSIKNKKWQLLLLAAAALTGYSRIYLAQHFLVDVMAGALLGSLSGILAIRLVNSLKLTRKGIKKVNDFNNKLGPGRTVSIQAV